VNGYTQVLTLQIFNVSNRLRIFDKLKKVGVQDILRLRAQEYVEAMRLDAHIFSVFCVPLNKL